jgi:hypothetical protein
MLKEIKTRTEKRLLELMHLVNAFKRLDSRLSVEVIFASLPITLDSNALEKCGP